MAEIKDLRANAANEKIKQLSEEIGTCMFCTYDGYALVSRPMTLQKTDEDGTLWFLSDKDSAKNAQLAQNPNVQLFFCSGHDRFLSVHGKASISYDREKIQELWDPIAKVWFTEGVDDPRISVIAVRRDTGRYWDTKHGKMVEFAMIAASLLTGKTMDDGIEGALQ